MADTIDDGGPAFPCEGGPASGLHPNSGMSLRDWFAGQALAGIMANPIRWADIQSRYDRGLMTYGEASRSNAVKAYSIADAMLAERAKRGK